MKGKLINTRKEFIQKGESKYFIDEIEVSKIEYKRYLNRENRKRYVKEHPLCNQIAFLLSKYKTEIDMSLFRSLNDIDQYKMLVDCRINDKIHFLKKVEQNPTP